MKPIEGDPFRWIRHQATRTRDLIRSWAWRENGNGVTPSDRLQPMFDLEVE